MPSIDDHDLPTARAIHATERQAQRARRAETARQRQRAALLDLLAQTMAEMHILDVGAQCGAACARRAQPERDRRDRVIRVPLAGGACVPHPERPP
ncbi:hypothetical protein JVX96_27805 (plasmid) [Variovorax sp. PDNC026]|uniref:hypothetical protein n=1 Tax=Variovorax sp. PDNC026 TaxID=2811425 RepID=UPI001963F0C5|nr:hypothetical protein [Variovorax sp. PDNC026]QRY35150.1 hypothetical protein JVX96_27805 [Variovorax sp. PDNC026]